MKTGRTSPLGVILEFRIPQMPFSKPFWSRDFCLKTPKLRKPVERRTLHMSRKLQRLQLKYVKMANVKQRHLRHFRVFQKSYHV